MSSSGCSSASGGTMTQHNLLPGGAPLFYQCPLSTDCAPSEGLSGIRAHLAAAHMDYRPHKCTLCADEVRLPAGRPLLDHFAQSHGTDKISTEFTASVREELKLDGLIQRAISSHTRSGNSSPRENEPSSESESLQKRSTQNRGQLESALARLSKAANRSSPSVDEAPAAAPQSLLNGGFNAPQPGTSGAGQNNLLGNLAGTLELLQTLSRMQRSGGMSANDLMSAATAAASYGYSSPATPSGRSDTSGNDNGPPRKRKYTPQRDLANRPMKYVCSDCGEGFPDKQRMDSHSLVHIVKDHQCQHCTRAYFATETALNIHMGKRHPDIVRPTRKQVCEVCGMNFRERTLLAKHMQMHNKRTDFKCPECTDIYFDTLHALNIHMGKTHYKDQVHECPRCGQSFTSRFALEKHADTAHRPTDFKCTICIERYFDSEHSLNIHVGKTHGSGTDHSCVHCKQSFPSAATLDKHSKAAHTPTDFKCPECVERYFDARHSLNIHMGKVHATPGDTKCPVCGELYTSRQQLNKHMIVHGRGTEYKCPYCVDTSFENGHSLNIHIGRRHPNELLKTFNGNAPDGEETKRSARETKASRRNGMAKVESSYSMVRRESLADDTRSHDASPFAAENTYTPPPLPSLSFDTPKTEPQIESPLHMPQLVVQTSTPPAVPVSNAPPVKGDGHPQRHFVQQQQQHQHHNMLPPLGAPPMMSDMVDSASAPVKDLDGPLAKITRLDQLFCGPNRTQGQQLSQF